MNEKKVAITEINVGGSEEKWNEMRERSGGRRTVPQIFIDGEHVGGSDDLMILEAQGKLDGLLAERATE